MATPVPPRLKFARSPIIIPIDTSSMALPYPVTSSRVEIKLWRICATEPVKAQYVLSKNVVSATQTLMSYNISNYIKEFINPIYPELTTTINDELDEIAVNIKVTSFFTYGPITDLYLDTYSVVTNGYTLYTTGRNVQKTLPRFLCNTNIKINVMTGMGNYVDFITDNVDFTHTLFFGSRTYEVYHSDFTPTCDISIWKIPVSWDNYGDNAGGELPTYLKLVYDNQFEEPLYYKIPIAYVEECKYQPVNIYFINSYGGWQPLIFFKNRTTSATVKGTDYKLAQDDYNYNPSVAQYQSININGKRTHKLNTGWIDENYNELIENLMVSETILMDGVPVNCKTQTMEYKTDIKDKMINYTIVFEEAFNLINDMV